MPLVGLPILDPDEVRISELEDISIDILKTEKEKEQRLKKTEYQGLWDNYKSCSKTCNENARRRRKRKKEQKKYLKE